LGQHRLTRRDFLAGAAITAVGAATGAYLILGPAKSAYPELLLKAPDDLSKILFVGVHPFERFHQHMNKWGDVFRAYHTQFLDRGTGFNDTDYTTGVDGENLSLAHSLTVYVASYTEQNPQENGDWSFRRKYYALLPAADRWTDAHGTPQDDPYASSGGRDINGSLIVTYDGYVMMSTCSPFWADYHKRSIEYFLDSGMDAIDNDCCQVVPSAIFVTGDFNDWYLKAFHRYLREKYDDEMLRSWGITDPLAFDFKGYLLRRYVSTATANKYDDGQPFFTTDPLDKPLRDPIVRAWVKFSYRTLLDFHQELSAHAKQYGQKVGKPYVPYFGNLYLGHPSVQLSNPTNASVILGQVMDIVQIESLPAVPPLRLTTIYKVGLAMGGYRKPVWGLHAPYYGYDYEPKLPLSADRSYVGLLKLYVAEAYAAGAVPEIDLGGWPGMSSPYGLFVTEDGDTLQGVVRYLDFVSEHQDIFLGAKPSSEVALVYSIPTFMWHDQSLWGIWHDEQTAAFVGFARAMEESQIPYDVLILGHHEVWDDVQVLESLSRYKTVVLPFVDCIDDAQSEAIKRFAEAGGNLIAVGALPVRDEDYALRKEPTLTQTNVPLGKLKFVPLSTLTEYYQNSIRDAHFDPDNRKRIVSPLGNARQVTTNASQDVGINIFNRGSRTIVHLVNYAYDPETDQIEPKKNISLKIRVPAADQLTHVESLSPDFEETNILGFVAQGEFASFTLPELRTWTTITME
jgi:hypothetical protein